MKSLIVFDLDGTLAESKSPLDKEMARLLRKLLSVAKVALGWPLYAAAIAVMGLILPDASRT